MFNPPISDLHTSFDDVSRLLAIITDPAAHRQRLEELVTREKAIDDKTAKLNAIEAEIPRLHSTAVATNIVADRRIAALDAREAELEARAKSIEDSETRHSVASLQRRENAADAKEQALKNEAARLAAMRTDLEARLTKLKTFSSTL